MKHLKNFGFVILLITSLVACNSKEYRYIDLNTGKKVDVIKDSVSGTMMNAETHEPVLVYYDTQTKDTVYGTTGEVINNKVTKTADGKYEYTPAIKTEEVTEQKEKVKTQEELDLEKLNKYGNYKKKVTGDGDIKVKEGDTKIKYDAKTGEKTVKHD